MKNKSTLPSALVNLRILVGLCVVLVGVFLALAGFGVFSVIAQSIGQEVKIITQSDDPLVPVPFDCSRIQELGIDKQENFRAQAIMIACGQAEGGKAASSSPLGALTQAIMKLLMPFDYGTTDANLITGTETLPNVTQSETFTLGNPDNPLQMLVAYNDSRGRNFSPINIGGASWSTDGGNTFVRLTGGNGQGPFAGVLGDPAAFYHRPSQTWMTIWLDTVCGIQGIGGFRTTTPGNADSWTHFCVHNGGNDDRESAWADNNPSSPFYGRLYVSYNDFTVGSGALFVTRSTDGGMTWNSVQLSTNFIRDVQLTGDEVNANVYVMGMDEGGGGCGSARRNVLYKSTDGGATWTNPYTGPTFMGPCRTAAGYFGTMYDNPAYWTYMGWGQPAARNTVVHYVYGACGAGGCPTSTGDPSNVFYIRSTDGGATFSAPLMLNTDGDPNKAQWQPSLSIGSDNSLLAVWYDERERTAASCQPSSPDTPCYRMWARKSVDGGTTWMPDMPFSDVVTPLPLQVDPGIRTTYAGDYDYGNNVLTVHMHAWDDGRNTINGSPQQDAYHDREPNSVSLVVVTSNPACGSSVFGAAPIQFVMNMSDPVVPSSLQAGDFSVNGISADNASCANNCTVLTFSYNTTPVVQGQNTMEIPAGALTRASDGSPNLAFNCTFRYGATQLSVVNTVPPVGGTFTLPAPNTYTLDVNWNMAVDPTSVQTSDLHLSGQPAATVTNVQVINNNTTTRFTFTAQFGGPLTATIASGAIIDTFGNPNANFTSNYTVAGCPPADHYTISQIGGSIVPGTTDTGNHIDDGTTTISLPFSYGLYDQTFTQVTVDSNGKMHFPIGTTLFGNTCLPQSGTTYSVYPYWDDLRTDVGLSGCTTWANGCGIFTSVSGTAPNRIFNIEWHAVYFANNAQTTNFEVRLYENQTRFDVIYGTVTLGNSSATAGAQKDPNTFDAYFCNGQGNPSTGGQSYILQSCVTSVVSAVSRKNHGGAGAFDIALPVTGTPGVECRSAGGTNDYTMLVIFSANVTVTGSPQAQVTMGTGCVGAAGTCSGNVSVNGNVVTVPLTNIANAQTINVRVNGVNSADQPATDFTIPMSILLGDTNANGTVNAADVAQTKSHLGQTVDATDYRSDVNTNGSINAADTAIVKQNSGTSLPP